MKKSKAITIITASFILFGVAACKPLPASIDQIVTVDAPSCITEADCLPPGPPAPPPTTSDLCFQEACANDRPDPACPTVADCLPPGPPPPPTTVRPCGLTDSEPCP